MKHVIVVFAALIGGFIAGVNYRDYSLDYQCKTKAIVKTNFYKWYCGYPPIDEKKQWPYPYDPNRRV